MVKKWIFVLIPLLIVAVAAAVIGVSFLRPAPEREDFAQPVVLHEMQMASAISTLKVLGLVSADKRVDLIARVSGFLLEKSFQEGDLVKAGQLLFQIEPDQYKAGLSAAQADVASAQAQLNRATLDFNRASDLYNKRSTPKSELDNASAALDVAKAALQAAQARLEQADLNLRYTTIKAPFDGKVSDSPFSEGNFIKAESDVLASVVAIDQVEVTTGISDSVMGLSRFGDERSGLPGATIDNVKVSIVISGKYEYESIGEIVYVAPEVDRNTDTIKIKVRFPNPGGVLLPGQSVVVNITPKEPRQVLLLPKAAFMTSEGTSFVYLTAPSPDGEIGEDGKPAMVSELRTVVVGDEFQDGFEVISGLEPGEKVVVLGLMSAGSRLRPGASVMVVDVPADQPDSADQDSSPDNQPSEGESEGGAQ
jgi:membrane fusion protein (multidrug efflux system)